MNSSLRLRDEKFEILTPVTVKSKRKNVKKIKLSP
jgi:hypothetical protein